MSALRYLWPGPITLIGFLFALIIRVSGGRIEKVDRAWEAHGGGAARLLWLMNPRARIAAIVFGHIVLARDAPTAARLRIHEHTHVRQYERWGVIFPFAYLLSSGVAWVYGNDPYFDNGFEREAIAADAVAQGRAPDEADGDIEKRQ
jgi:hypothetical protein